MPKRAPRDGQTMSMSSATVAPQSRPATEVRAAQVNAVALATGMWPDDPEAPREILEALGLFRRTGMEREEK